MWKLVKNILKNMAQWALILAILSVAVDWWRAPATDGAAMPMPQPVMRGDSVAHWGDDVWVVYFWGSWCGVCRHTSPVIERLHNDGMRVLSVAISSGSAKEVYDFQQKSGYTFATINDERGVLAKQWGVKVTPTVVFVRQGKVVHGTTGLATYWGLWARWHGLKWRYYLLNQ